jgi:nitrate reductase NapD
MNISSLVLRARPERLPVILERLRALPGVEVHAATDEGRVVVTLESEDGGGAADSFSRFSDIEGVLAVSLVYEYSE